MLDAGHYVFGRYNEYCIPQKKSYHTRYYVHDFIIYGYDKVEQVYYSAGYHTADVFFDQGKRLF